MTSVTSILIDPVVRDQLNKVKYQMSAKYNERLSQSDTVERLIQYYNSHRRDD